MNKIYCILIKICLKKPSSLVIGLNLKGVVLVLVKYREMKREENNEEM